MTPYDILRKWTVDMSFIPPEGVDLMIVKTCAAIKRCEKIFDVGPKTEAAQEAIEVLSRLRRCEAELRLHR